ncbi:hypothetical protein RBB50_001271 [Rhinocladiella similis]
MITTAPKFPHLYPRQGASADPGSTSCDLWLSMESSCTAATPSFLDLPFIQEASCLCYSGTVWQPSTFDNAFQNCLNHLSTASPSQWSAMGGSTSLITTPCAKAGNVVATPPPGGNNITVKTGPSSTRTVTGNSAACKSWDALEITCAGATTSFTALPFEVEASCLCYSSSSYAPFIYDSYLDQCLAYLSTADTTFYASLGGDQLPRSPCSQVGNVANGPVATVTAASPSGSSTGSGNASSPTHTTSLPLSTSSKALTTTVPTTASSSDAVGLLIHPLRAGGSALLATLMLLTMS